MVEERSVDHRSEDALAHTVDDLVKADRRADLDGKLSQINWVRAVGILDHRGVRPRRKRGPTVPDKADAADSLADRLQHSQHLLHGPPAEPVVAHIEHPILLGAEIQWHLPCRVISVEEEWAHVLSERMERRLTNLVGQAIAHIN